MGNTSCQTEMKPLKHQRSEFTMSVGKHKATVRHSTYLFFDLSVVSEMFCTLMRSSIKQVHVKRVASAAFMNVFIVADVSP